MLTGVQSFLAQVYVQQLAYTYCICSSLYYLHGVSGLLASKFQSTHLNDVFALDVCSSVEVSSMMFMSPVLKYDPDFQSKLDLCLCYS